MPIIDGKKVRYVEGLGDKVERFLHTGMVGKVVKAVTGLDQPCRRCEERKKKLNKWGQKGKI